MKDEITQEPLEESILIEFLLNDSMEEFREEFMQLHPYDQSIFFEKVEPDVRMKIYHYLSPKEIAELFEATKFDDEQYDLFMQEMDITYAADMLSFMFTDNAVDVLNELGKDKVASYLNIMDKESAQEIKDLLHYEEYTAGSIMTTEYVVNS